jgi:predicted aspartyl protease
MNIVQCWSLNERIGAFTIPVKFINPQTRDAIVKNCIYDTGFTGFFSLDQTTIEALSLERIGHGIAFTVSGEVEYNNYVCNVELVDDVEATIRPITNPTMMDDGFSIPIQEMKVPFMGMKAIQQFSWLLVAQRKWLCLVDD